MMRVFHVGGEPPSREELEKAEREAEAAEPLPLRQVPGFL